MSDQGAKRLTAAEWLEDVLRYSGDFEQLRLAFMLRDAKAELGWRPSTGDRVQVDGYDETGIYCNGFHGTVLGHVGACCMLVKLDENRGNVTVGWRQLSKASGGWDAIERKWRGGGYK